MKKSITTLCFLLLFGCYGLHDRHGNPEPEVTRVEIGQIITTMRSATDGSEIGLVWGFRDGSDRSCGMAIFSAEGRIIHGVYSFPSGSVEPFILWTGEAYLVFWIERGDVNRLRMNQFAPGGAWDTADAHTLIESSALANVSDVKLFGSDLVIVPRYDAYGENPFSIAKVMNYQTLETEVSIVLGQPEELVFGEALIAKSETGYAFVMSQLESDVSGSLFFQNFNTSTYEASGVTALELGTPKGPLQFWQENGDYHLLFREYGVETAEVQSVSLDASGSRLSDPTMFGSNSAVGRSISMALSDSQPLFHWLEDTGASQTLFVTSKSEVISELEPEYEVGATAMVSLASHHVAIWSDADQPFLNFLSIPR